MALSWADVHRIAALEVARASRRLKIDRSRKIDPFAALGLDGVLVMRRPLDHLAGVYLPAQVTGDAQPGVLINVQHPLSKQRYTAAHELCHHQRDRQVAIDLDTDWIARGQEPTSDRERIAEAFAAWFLMPKELVLSTVSRLGLEMNHLAPEGAYALALELGTSYEATVNHLADLPLITRAQRNQLLSIPPQTIKSALGAIGTVADSWRDIWLVRRPSHESEIEIQEGDAVVLEVTETPTSGYLWQPAAVSDGIMLVRDEYRSLENSDVIGGDGAHRFLFRIEAPGRREIRLELRRPWQRALAPIEEYRLQIEAEQKPAAGIVNPRRLVANVA